MTSTPSPDELHARGIEMHRAGRLAEAEACYRGALELDPDRMLVWSHLGSALCQAGRYQEGANAFANYVQHAPAIAGAHADFARALRASGAVADAHREYGCALELEPGDGQLWIEHAATLGALGDWSAAAAAYGRAMQLKPTASAAAAQSSALLAAGRPTEAALALNAALLRYPNDAKLCAQLGELQQGLGSIEKALATYGRGILLAEGDPEQKDTLARLLYRRAALRASTGQLELAATDSDRLMAIDPLYPYATGLGLYVSMMNCDWDGLETRVQGALTEVRRGAPSVPPWILIAAADRPEEQLSAAQTWVHTVCAAGPDPLWNANDYQHDRLRLAYVSADFGDHPVGRVLANILEHHDRRTFELIGVSIAEARPGPLLDRLRAGFDRFLEGSRVSDLEVARWLRAQEVDLAVDLTGYTARSRPNIFAARPAPIQVNFLGYPGTMGAPFMDYIVADRVVIPPESAHFFSEQVAYLPRCLLPPSGPGQAAAAPPRSELGLPAGAMVFAAFHTTYKITASMFATWLGILRRAPRSVLWLGSSGAEFCHRLRTAAMAQGVDPERLVFAPRVPHNEDHLARLMQADLFLDTLPYNAHTSASDALRCGVPVLTCAGRSFAARVCASLLTSMGLPEMITGSLAEYEDLAVAIAGDPIRRTQLRERLASRCERRFDGAGYCADLEELFKTLARRSQVAWEGIDPDVLSFRPARIEAGD